jgi:hypothetical protein
MKKGNVFHCLVQHAIKAQDGMEVQLQVLLTSEVDEDEWQASRSDRLILRWENTLSTHLIRSSMDPREDMGTVDTREIVCPAGNPTDSLSVEPSA